MITFLYVDNSNLWIEGQRFSAVRNGLAQPLDQAMHDEIVDPGWRYDFGRLYRCFLSETDQVGQTLLVGSRPPENDSLWEIARDAGFTVEVFDRNFKNQEKQVDTAIATQMAFDVAEHMVPRKEDARLLLVSGDNDYAPPLEKAKDRGIHTEVAFWSHATGRALRDACAEFSPLDDRFEEITTSSKLS